MVQTQQEVPYGGVAERIFMILASLFIACLVLTNVMAGKYFSVWGLPLSSSILVYPLSFVITDIVSEIYGLQRANMLVFMGFVVSVVITALVWFVHSLPTAPQSPVDAASFNALFGLFPGVVLGSMSGYLAAQLVDVHLFEYLRKKTNHRHLWLRNNVATLTSQLLDTLLVVTIAWVVWPRLTGQTGNLISWQMWGEIVLSQYLGKAVVALLDTPVVYVSIYLIGKRLGLRRP